MANKSDLRSANARLAQQRRLVMDMEEKIKNKETRAPFENANGEVADNFTRQAADEREDVDQRLGELKQELNDLKALKEQECYSSFPQEIQHRLKKKWARCDCPPPDSFGGVEVPKNIEHFVKTQQLKELMSDPEKVQASFAANEAEKQKQVKTELVTKLRPDLVKIPDGDAIYYELSSALRSNTFPGYAWDQTYGVEKSTYTNEVFKKAAAIAPRPDSQEAKNLEAYRYKADDFTRWRESFFIREQQAKRWTSVQNDKKANGK